MQKYTKEELEEALQVINETSYKCEKMLPKFEEGTAQHTLLKNRIKTLHISKSLIKNEAVLKDELPAALAPISSIISKCEKARLKHNEGTYHYLSLSSMIKAMTIAKSFVQAAQP